jgi:outer membrane protein
MRRVVRSTLIVLFGFVAVVCAATARAQDNGAILTLDQAIATALDGNRLGRINALGEARAADDVEALKTQRLPRFDFKLFEGGVMSPITLTFGQGAFGTFPSTGPIPFAETRIESPRALSTAMLFTAVQPITQLWKVSAGEKLLDLGRQLAAEKTRASRVTLVAELRRAYFGLQQVGAGLTAAREALVQLEELDRVVGEYVAREAALPGDHLAVRTERARVDQSIVTMRNLEATLKERINLLMGRDLATPFVPAGEFARAEVEIDLVSAVAAAREQRPAVREAALNVQRAMEDAQLTERKRLPDVGIGITMARLFNVEVIPETIAAAGILVSWEPFDWGRRRLERADKARVVEQARLAQQEAEAAVTLDVSAKHRALLAAGSGLEVADLARQTASERLRVATDRYRVDAALLKDVLEAQTSLARTIQEYQQALGAFWTARADLDEAIGLLP